MRVCFVLSEIFAWGKYGGYGSMVRRLARGLLAQGVDVCAIVPRRSGQKPVEKLDGFTVFSYSGWEVLSKDVYRQINADIYHSQEATLATLGALRAMPGRRHMVTCIDPWDGLDWRIEFQYDLQDGFKRSLVYPFLWSYYGTSFVKRSVQRANAVFSQARYLADKVQRQYRLAHKPEFMPNPYPSPTPYRQKASQPTVCYLARWDPRKRPEIFFELAKRFPKVRFLALGKAHNAQRDASLRHQYGHISNLELIGHVNPFESDLLYEILDTSWIVVNTSAREGLPAAYVEAAAHQCAILSAVDADGFASRGGYYIKQGGGTLVPPECGGVNATIDDYADGLAKLIQGNQWRQKAEAGHDYFQRTHEQNRVTAMHIEVYETLVKARK